VHGKKSLLNKMFGDYDQKFASMRAFLTYMMTMPGKKMMFMGTEYAQFREWDYENQLEWFMLRYPRHEEMQRFVSEINNFYLESKELWEIDNSWDGYEWIETNQSDLNVISYKRMSIDKSELIVVVNFSPIKRENYRVTVDEAGSYKEALTTDEFRFGGTGLENKGLIKTKTDPSKLQNYFEINLPPYSGLIFRKIKGRARRVK
jgi:1,4-alpha-glucan branching enzyme